MNIENLLIFHWETVLFGGKHFCKGSGQMLTVQQEMCCSCGCFIGVIAYVLYIKEGGIISCVPLFLFLIHARGCVFWLLFPVSDPGSSALLATPCVIAQAEKQLRSNAGCGGHAASSEVCLSSRMNPSTWSHSFLLSAPGNFLFTTPAVFLLAIIFSLTHPY